MAKDKADEVFEEYRYNQKIVQLIRGLLFWAIEPDESRDRKALVILAEYAKTWAKSSPQRLTDDLQPGFLEFCQSIIDAGIKADGPDVPEPFRIGITTSTS